MKIEVDLKKYVELLRDFAMVVSKKNLKNGVILKLIIFIIGLLAFLITGRFLFEEYQKVYDILIIGVLLVILLIAGIITFSLILVKKQKIELNIVKLNYTFNEKIECHTILANGSETKTEYNYEDIKEFIETNKGYYMFLENNTALMLGKDDVNDIESFKRLLINKNIKIKEAINNENKL